MECSDGSINFSVAHLACLLMYSFCYLIIMCWYRCPIKHGAVVEMLDETSELAPRDLEAPMLFATWPGTILIPRTRLDYVIAQCESSVQKV